MTRIEMSEKLGRPDTSSDPNLAFDTWRNPNSDNATILEVEVILESSDLTDSQILLEVDDSGGTTADYSLSRSAPSGLSVQVFGFWLVVIPPGASYRINNQNDPLGNNSIDEIREFTLPVRGDKTEKIRENVLRSPFYDGVDDDPGLGNWSTPDADRAAFVIMEVELDSDGTNDAIVDIEVDESGGTTADYSFRRKTISAVSPNKFFNIFIPKGASYRVVNTQDPSGNNRLVHSYEAVI